MYKICAVSFNLETTLPKTGPGTSARMTSRWLFLLFSIMASAKTSTPIPPIKWAKLRQKRSECVKTLTSGKMVAPVVVNPELISKKASMMLGICPDKTKGSAPKKDQSTQQSATINIPSLV